METSRSLEQTSITLSFPNEQIQGLDSPFILSESVLQKIWLKQDFLSGTLKTLSKLPITVINPGRWNLLEGPDFLNATLKIDNSLLTGDIEVHFHEDDWLNHLHNQHPAYNKVILHILLFPPKSPGSPVFTTQASSFHILTLLDYLHQGLEEYALEDALLSLSKRNALEVFQSFLQEQSHTRSHILQQKAYLRWQQKVSFAQNRLASSTPETTCHQMVLEALGYKRNRVPMSALALKFPIQNLLSQPKNPQELFDSQHNWQLHGLRPANHPLKRLHQYTQLLQLNPQWISDWLHLANSLAYPSFDPSLSTSTFRKNYQLTALLQSIKNNILMNSLSGTRLNTLIVDTLIPIAAAHLNINLFPLWYHFFEGDISQLVSDFLHHCELTPHCNGLNQATLQLFLEHKL